MNLSKEFDTLKHDFLIAKLGACGFETEDLRYIKTYLTNRKQRVRVNKTFSEWERITTGVLQGSILGPLLFNIVLNDLFLFISNPSLSNYADDNTLYTFGDNLKKIKDNLRSSFNTVHQWFYENYMVLNAEKCHFMCLGNNTENETFLFNSILMENCKEQKILGVMIDNKLNFKSHISELCKNASQKIAALSRLSSYRYNSEKNFFFNLIIKSQFSYCPLVWMFCLRISNNMINKLHERPLRIILNDCSSDFNIILENNNDICNHHRNIEALLTEVFKVKNKLAPSIMESILNKRFNTYNLRNFQEFATERKKTVWYGLKTLSYRYPQLWSLMPKSLNEINYLGQFKRNIKHWICSDCPCRLCKVYIKILNFYNVKLYKFSNLLTWQPLAKKNYFIFLNFCR